MLLLCAAAYASPHQNSYTAQAVSSAGLQPPHSYIDSHNLSPRNQVSSQPHSYIDSHNLSPRNQVSSLPHSYIDSHNLSPRNQVSSLPGPKPVWSGPARSGSEIFSRILIFSTVSMHFICCKACMFNIGRSLYLLQSMFNIGRSLYLLQSMFNIGRSWVSTSPLSDGKYNFFLFTLS